MTGPKRLLCQVEGAIKEDPHGNLVWHSEYEALVEAFALYMTEGMDDAKQVFEVLEPHLGEVDARFIADMLEEAASEDPNDKPKGRKK